MKNKVYANALLTCGPRLCEIEDFLECCEKKIYNFRIHLGKTDRDNIKIIKNLISVQNIVNYKLGIYIDLPTTRPRLGKNLTNINKAIVSKGDCFNIIFQNNSMWKYNMNTLDNNIYFFNFDKYKHKLKNGNRIMLKDGSYSGVITKVNDYGAEVKCTSDVTLYDSESIVFPDFQIEYEVFDSNTKHILQEIKKNDIQIDKFIISFCHSRQMVIDVRKYLNNLLGYDVFIMAKIEDLYGVKNINEIALEADSVMIGRGDLGPSIGFDNLPKTQESLVLKVKEIGKPIYIATQFLEELAQNNHICPSELNDIFLAIIQKADGIMLSGEAGASPNSKKCIDTLYRMINYYRFPEENSMKNSNTHTQILATMGPTLQSVEDVSRMIELGVNQFRIHMGLRTRDFCGYYCNALKASKQLGKIINVLLDLPSTRPRVFNMDEYTYSEGEFAYVFDCASAINEDDGYTNIPLPNLTDIIQYIKIGEHIMFRDGHVVFEVKEKFDTRILVQCQKSDLCIKTGASSCFPESEVLFQPIDKIDVSYLERMKSEGMCPQRVAISFAATVEQIKIVRKILKEIWPNDNIEVICKIESKLGLKNINELIEFSDGIMIARGDLLLCINPYEMPKIQLELAKKCTEAKKTLIIATEFFERFAETGIVNRAELSDVALAVRQGANSIMLARETGNSKYSLDCVKIINSIINNENK